MQRPPSLPLRLSSSFFLCILDAFNQISVLFAVIIPTFSPFTFSVSLHSNVTVTFGITNEVDRFDDDDKEENTDDNDDDDEKEVSSP